MIKSVFIILAILTTSDAFEWKWTSQSATCDGDPFRNVNLSVVCTHGYYTREDPTHCGVGDTAYANGSLHAITPFSDGQVIVTPSVAGVDIIWDRRTYGHLSDWLHPLGDQKLGEAGYYTIRYAMSMPTQDGSWPGEDWLIDNLVTGHITVKNNGECNIEEEEEWFPVYNYAMVGLLSCSALTGLLAKKRRHRTDVNDDDDDDRAAPSYYEMAGDVSNEAV